MKDIEKEVIALLEDLCLSKIEDTSQTLTEDLAMDSLRLVMLLVMIEDAFEIELDESDMNPFVLLTAADVVELVSKYIKEDEENV